MTKIKSYYFLIVSLLFYSTGSFAQAVGDYGAVASGNWNTSIWGTWNGAGWTPVAGFPSSVNNVFITTGNTVLLPTGGPWNSQNLTVEAGGKLWTGNSATNVYIWVYGSIIQCDGQIGDGANFDGISFNIEGANCTISGAGLFDASRMRKSSGFSTTTNLTIAMSLNLRWNAASGTQLYNAFSNTRFNVTINAFCTVMLIPNGPNIGNVSIDGLSGSGIEEAGGTFTINGTLIISGILYLTTNNSNATYTCSWIINGLVQANEVVASASGSAIHNTTINSGGKLDITGTPAFSSLAITNNFFTFTSGSTVEYSANGVQHVRVAAEFASSIPANAQYGHLILSGSGLKSTNYIINPSLYVKNDLTISGSAVLDPNPSTSNVLVGGNWLNYNATGFLEKSTTVFMNGNTPQTISCPGGEVYYSLRYSKPATYLQFNNPVDVINQLVFANNGYIDLNSNALTVRNSSTLGIQGASNTRYIVSEKPDNSSKIIWRINNGTGTYVFPFGIVPGGAANYTPVRVAKSAATNIGDLTISTYGTPPDNQPWPTTPTNVTNLWAYNAIYNTPDNRSWTVDRFYEISSSSPVTVDSVTFCYRASELPTSDPVPSNLKAQFWAGAFNVWNLLQFGTGIAYQVKVPSFTYYNTAWTLTSITSPLPIELLSFEAIPEDAQVELKWTTATEINNDFFTIEKSIDGKEFFEISMLDGAGNSTIEINYVSYDKFPAYGISYYRLKQTDFDGQYSYSDIIPVNYKKRIHYSIFPNPADNSAYLVGDTKEISEVIIRTVDGKLINNFSVDGTTQKVHLTLAGLSEGLYIIEIKSEYETQFLRLLKR